MKKFLFAALLLSLSIGFSKAQSDSLKADSLVADSVKPLTSKKDWTSRKAIDSSRAVFLSDSLRANDSIYKVYWNTNVLFAYGIVDYTKLPEEITIPLVRGDEEFMMTWYGLLFWGFGQRWGRLHKGLDLDLEIGDTVVSAFDGIVRFAGSKTGGYGNAILVRHLNGLETLYGHLSKICVQPNQYVKAGQLIGLGGSTGRSNGPHLHFETRFKDLAFGSFIYIDTLTHRLKNDTLVLKIKDWTVYTNAAASAQGAQTPQLSDGWYIVQRGDCLYRIAKRYGTTVDRIKVLNRMTGDMIHPGQKLRVK